MPSPILTDLTSEVGVVKTVAKSATKLINGYADRERAAIDKALANGATSAELAPLIELNTSLRAEREALAAAVAENTVAESESQG